MSWKAILKYIEDDLIVKAIPLNEIRLAQIIQREGLTEKTLEVIENNIENNRQLNTKFVSMINNLKRIPIDEGLKRLLSKMPMPKMLSDEQIRQNYEKILNATVIVDAPNLAKLVDEALEAHKNGNMEKFQELKAKIQKNPALSKDQKAKNKKLTPKLNYLMSLSPNWTLKFTHFFATMFDTGDFKKDLEEFTKKANKILKKTWTENRKPKILVENDKLITHVASSTEFVKFIQGDKEIKELYLVHLRNYGPDLKGKEKIAGSLTELDAHIGQGLKMNPINITTYSHVKDYLDALELITGRVKAFIPTKLKNGSTFPQNGVLERVSGNTTTLVINPFLDIILSSSFDQNWFNSLFQGLRMRGFTSDSLAKNTVIRDIYEKLTDNSDATESTYGADLNQFRDLQDSFTGKEKSDMNKLREYIQNYATINTRIDELSLSFQKNRLKQLEKYYTLDEIETIDKWWDSLDNELKEEIEEEIGDFEIEYRDFEGNELTTNLDAKSYGVVLLDGEEMSPNDFEKEIQELREYFNIDEIKSDKKLDAFKTLRRVLIGSQGETSEFTEFLLSFDEENALTNIISKKTDSAAFMEKLSPENSLAFLAKLGRRIDKGSLDIAGTFKSIDSANPDKKVELAEGLNDKMSDFLNKARKQLIEAFDITLKDFANNPEKYNTERKFGKIYRSSAIVAKEKLASKGLLRD